MRKRLDRALMDLGLAQSRERARALIMEGKVLVNGAAAAKAGSMVDELSSITLLERDIPFVSRGGVKLEAALEHFGVDLMGKVAMDVGASTGGFTDCMLKRGAARVYCIDVGYGQFDWRLRNDPRVVLMERTNIRHLAKEVVPEPTEISAIDVSFISLRLVIPKVMEFLEPGGAVMALVKPQFELERKDIGKGGIVRDEAMRLEAVESVSSAAVACGMSVVGSVPSPIKGQKGNVEYFLYLKGG